MSELIIQFQWEIFIIIEVLGLLSLLLFGFFRYKLQQNVVAKSFIIGFILLTAIEAILAWFVFTETGEISSCQIIVTLFVLYAITFGYQDFKKLDRWMRKKIDAENLLTEADYQDMQKQKDPRYQARYYATTWIIHLCVFITAQIILFGLSGLNLEQSLHYLSDLSWIESDHYKVTPYSNQSFHSVSMIWGIILVVDTIIAATYVFQKKDVRKN